MKHAKRTHRDGSPVVKNKKPKILSNDGWFEPNLKSIAEKYDALKCRALAAIFLRWGNQLQRKAKFMEAMNKIPVSATAMN